MVRGFVVGFTGVGKCKKAVCLLVCRVCVMRCIALSCLEIRRPFR